MDRKLGGLIFLVLLAAMTPAVATADFYTGQDLHRMLASKNLDEYAVAHGYIVGAHDQRKMMAALYAEKAMPCTPDGLTAGQLVAVVKKFLDDNPEHWDRSASAIVLVAIQNAWPCGDS